VLFDQEVQDRRAKLVDVTGGIEPDITVVDLERKQRRLGLVASGELSVPESIDDYPETPEAQQRVMRAEATARVDRFAESWDFAAKPLEVPLKVPNQAAGLFENIYKNHQPTMEPKVAYELLRPKTFKDRLKESKIGALVSPKVVSINENYLKPVRDFGILVGKKQLGTVKSTATNIGNGIKTKFNKFKQGHWDEPLAQDKQVLKQHWSAFKYHDYYSAFTRHPEWSIDRYANRKEEDTRTAEKKIHGLAYRIGRVAIIGAAAYASQKNPTLNHLTQTVINRADGKIHLLAADVKAGFHAIANRHSSHAAKATNVKAEGNSAFGNALSQVNHLLQQAKTHKPKQVSHAQTARQQLSNIFQNHLPKPKVVPRVVNTQDLTWKVANELKPGHETSLMNQAMRRYSAQTHMPTKFVGYGTNTEIEVGRHIISPAEMHHLNEIMDKLAKS